MKLEHVAMYVEDLEQAKEFFETYFEGKANERYHNINTGLQTYFISFDDGARLEIMTRPHLVISDAVPYETGYTHLAFSVGSKEKVDTLTKQLQEAGYQVVSGPRTTGDGYYESCIVGFEGHQIEITE